MDTRKINAHNELLLLKDHLLGAIIKKNGLQLLELDPAIGNGQIHCVTLNNWLTAFEFDIQLNKDCELILDKVEDHMVYLFYCLKGHCFHKFKGGEVVNKLDELQTAVLFNDDENKSKFIFKQEERTILNCIRINLSVHGTNDTIDEGDLDIMSLLKNYNKSLGYFHFGKYNLEIGELIKKLENAKYADSISNLMYFQGLCHIIMAKQLEQFEFDLSNGLKSPTTLLKKELEMISELGDFIINYPELPHTINALSAKSGLSPSKLQLGFKFMHDMTLGEYIREVRLKKAELLIRTSDLNISQVVYSIGFTSRSYFCKIFKKKYNCSPKSYKTQAFDSIIA
ncbi:helix-turn-helix domain-containing protein [Maribacter sp. ACAM166]|uniref:helix-turn-helix domain-containing protein n=1 Tax=Maribacter sp. ACAM166 TaxID=2508996 RepID=UPI0010FDBDE9|nr:AraC family transcriptional regulator [Maribacter sp. ACAM166]TLP70617.1 helix-turn-helix transcriptional regulator [Maribacter sp. ACAM166]